MKQQKYFVLFRALTALIFIYAGLKHIFNSGKILGRIQQCTLYQYLPYNQLFSVLVIVSGVVMMVAAFMLLSGKFQKISSIILLVLLIGITLTIQLDNLADLGPFFKNVAIAGSLFFIIKTNSHEIKSA